MTNSPPLIQISKCKLFFKVRLIGFCLLFVWSGAKSQDFYDDDRLWLYFKFDRDIGSKFNAQLVLQNRFHNNVTEFSQWNANMELSCKLGKNFRIIGGYVYGTKLKPEGYYIGRHQAYLGFVLRKRFNHFLVSYRNLVQGQTEASYSWEKARVIHYYDRNKLTVKYELSKYFEMYVAGEANIPFYRTDEYEGYLSRTRGIVGLQWNLSRRDYLEGYFIYQRKYTYKAGYQDRAWIFGLTYSHTF